MRLLKTAGFLILLSTVAEAKIFSFGTQTFAAYFNVTGGQPSLGDSALLGETSLPLSYSSKASQMLSGEFGVSYSSPRGNLRFGVEVLKPQDMNGNATNGSTSLYLYDSASYALTPKITIDMTLHGDKTSRSYIAGFIGVSYLNLKNSYTLTPTGEAQFSGVSNHTVEMDGQATLAGGTLGYEAHFSDRTTIFLEFGYRVLKFDSIKYKGGGTTFGGTYTGGQTVMAHAGSGRVQDYTGAFASLGFRFYL